MKTNIFICFIAFASILWVGNAQAQTQWTLGQSTGNVEFYYSITACGADSVVFLKFVNSNNTGVKVTWNEVFDTQEEAGAKGYFGPKTLVLQPGTTEQSDCSSVDCPDCLILPTEVSPAYPANIRHFAFSDVTVH